MNDEQFEYQMRMVEQVYNPTVVAALRARDTAQREALGRVGAERDKARSDASILQEWSSVYVQQRNSAQAQLAEALGLLRKIMNSSGCMDILDAEKAITYFLTQAEQQEAQSPMAKIAEGLRQKAADEWADHPSNPANQEALARVEAEAGRLAEAGLAAHVKATAAQAQLAEAVGLIRKAMEYSKHIWSSDAHAFLARHAQGAQAGDERAVFCDAVREAAKEFLDTVDEEGLKRDAFGEFVHPEPKQLLRICQLYRAALATQPADSIAVNRLRLSLVAWDAELAEQDYQLTADDLREKLREIHRDIDRLMPEQNQPAVRGAEHDQ